MFKKLLKEFIRNEDGFIGNLIGGVLGAFGGRKRGRRIKGGGRQAQAFLAKGRDFALNQSGLDAFRDRGSSADQTFFDALGLGDDPAAADAAFQRFQDSTGFRSQLQAGQDAIGAGTAASGKFNSGATGRALVSFGQGLGRRSFQDFLGNLNAGAGRGLAGAQGLSNAATGTSSRQAQTAFRTESDSAAARDAGNQDFFSGLGGALGSIF